MSCSDYNVCDDSYIENIPFERTESGVCQRFYYWEFKLEKLTILILRMHLNALHFRQSCNISTMPQIKYLIYSVFNPALVQCEILLQFPQNTSKTLTLGEESMSVSKLDRRVNMRRLWMWKDCWLTALAEDKPQQKLKCSYIKWVESFLMNEPDSALTLDIFSLILSSEGNDIQEVHWFPCLTRVRAVCARLLHVGAAEMCGFDGVLWNIQKPLLGLGDDESKAILQDSEATFWGFLKVFFLSKL